MTISQKTTQAQGPGSHNVSQKCNYDPVFCAPAARTSTDLARVKVAKACVLFTGRSLDAEKFEQEIIYSYEADGVTILRFVTWSAGARECIRQGNRETSEGGCSSMMMEVINGCSSDDPNMT
jgi:hypothetical protein